MYGPTAALRSPLGRRASLVVLGLGCWLAGSPLASAAPPEAPTPAAAPAAASAAATTPAAAAAAPAARSAAPDFPASLGELRAALGQATTLRKGAADKGDKLKEACLYERQRALAQVVESAQAAAVAFEAASARSDQNAARAEQARLVKALELGRQHREAAESCVGNDLAVRPRATSVTVDGPKQGDDPQAGPSEAWTVRPARLELPSRPNPASAFRPTR